MNELALFAGAGGGILGSHLLGWRTVAAVEIEEYPRAVLLQRQLDGILPKFPIWDDVCTFDGKPWRGKIDVISGGFPCQDISAAGRGAGITGARSGLWSEMARIIGEVRPSYVFVENSPMLVIRGLDRVLADLTSLGYDAKWGVFSGYHIGAPIERKRIFLFGENAGTDKKSRERTKSKLLSKKPTKKQFWSIDTFAALLERDKKQLPVISGNERVVNGLPYSMDRFAAVGNAQIPAVVRLAWETLNNI